LVTLFEASTQRVEPAVPGVVKPFKVKNESASVFTVTPLVPEGEKVDWLLAVKLPLRVVAPVTPKVPPRLVAPVPTEKVLEPVTEVGAFKEMAPVPVERVVAPVWEKLPAVVTSPVRVEAPSTVKLPLAWMLPAVEIVTPVEP